MKEERLVKEERTAPQVGVLLYRDPGIKVSDPEGLPNSTGDVGTMDISQAIVGVNEA